MAHQHKRQKVETSEKELIFSLNSTIIIRQMLELSEQTQDDSTALVDEILHSIFLLGKISFRDFSPHWIENDMKQSDQLRRRFPNAFACYSSELPRRCPISCLLDMIVQVEGQQNERQIIKKLQEIMDQLEKYPVLLRCSKTDLISSAICVSQKDDSLDSIRYYGVSMSTSGCHSGRIMIAASCLSCNWNSDIADAVMTYYPTKSKKSYFDGTIKLPKGVRCETFSLSTGKEMLPCRSCGNMFGLHTTVEQEWPHGNCAEVESLSNLLKKEEHVKRETKPISEMWTDENRQKAKEEVKRELKRLLKEKNFKWNDRFYTPQRAISYRKRKSNELT